MAKKKPKRGRTHDRKPSTRTAPAPVPEQRNQSTTAVDLTFAVDENGDAYVDLVVGATTLPAVQLLPGCYYSPDRKRPVEDGWGFTIELAAVMDLLALVERGAVGAGQVSALLRHAAEVVLALEAEQDDEEERAPQRLREACRVQGGCVLCRERTGMFNRFLDQAVDRWRRFRLPEQYPFATSRHGVHESSCSVVTSRMPDQFARPSGNGYTAALHTYAHTLRPFGDDDFEGTHTYPIFSPMTAQELHAWIADNTGPKGGRNYRTCQLCGPAV